MHPPLPRRTHQKMAEQYRRESEAHKKSKYEAQLQTPEKMGVTPTIIEQNEQTFENVKKLMPPTGLSPSNKHGESPNFFDPYREAGTIRPNKFAE